jgi:hypothetical protein
MTREEAQRTVTAGRLWCAHWGDSSELTVKWEACEGEASAKAQRLKWTWIAATSPKEDACFAELDENNRVSEASYAPF